MWRRRRIRLAHVLLGLAGCRADPTPDALAARVLAADLPRTALRAVDPAGPLARWRELALTLDRVDAERARLREIAAALPAPANGPTCRAGEDRVACAYRTELEGRYAPSTLTDTLASLDGVTLDGARHLLARVDHEYHLAPDWPAMGRAARLRLTWLAEQEAARTAWPGLGRARWPEVPVSDLPAAVTALEATVAAAAGVPAEVIVAEWVAGALSALDPWTRAVWPAEMARWNAHHAGTSVGVGLDVGVAEDGVPFVVDLAPGGPAWSEGVHTGDRLAWIEEDGKTRHLGDEADAGARAVEALGGTPGTIVRLGVLRSGEERAFTLRRAEVRDETVQGHHRAEDDAWVPWLAPGVAYARIRAFRPHTPDELDVLLHEALEDTRAVMLDLRGCPGGDVNAAVEVADRFVADGVLARLSGRVPPAGGPLVDPVTGAALVPWNHAVPGHALEGLPLVVLVDEDTFSAAELLAGALQERAGALVVGAATWGKGLSQALRAEPALGYAVQLTNVVWTLPSGRLLSPRAGGGGIVPDVPLSLDAPTRRELEVLARHRGALQARAGTPAPPPSPPALSADPALVLGELVARALLVRQEASDQ